MINKLALSRNQFVFCPLQFLTGIKKKKIANIVNLYKYNNKIEH